jgi:hypothetical protein
MYNRRRVAREPDAMTRASPLLVQQYTPHGSARLLQFEASPEKIVARASAGKDAVIKRIKRDHRPDQPLQSFRDSLHCIRCPLQSSRDSLRRRRDALQSPRQERVTVASNAVIVSIARDDARVTRAVERVCTSHRRRRPR